MARINFHIIPSSIVNASRVFKETETIIKSTNFQRVILLGTWDKSLAEIEDVGDGKRIIYRLKLLKDRISPATIFWKVVILFSFIQYRVKILYFISKYRPTYVNCHQIILLPISVFGKFLFKYKLIYDIHELETEVDGLHGFKKKYLKLSERLFIKHVDEVVVVGEKIAEWYRKEYRITNVHVVRNFPKQQYFEESRKSLLKEELNICDDELLFIYNGFLTTGRGIELTLKAFSKLNNKYHIMFMGYGPLVKLAKEYEFKFTNIHFKNAVLPSEVIKYTKGADIGVIILENTCLSYYYAMPNKLFEYIQAGIPAIVSNFPEMSAIIDKYECGWKIEPEAGILQKFIEELTQEDILIKKQKLDLCKYELCWEKESIKYQLLFNN